MENLTFWIKIQSGHPVDCRQEGVTYVKQPIGIVVDLE